MGEPAPGPRHLGLVLTALVVVYTLIVALDSPALTGPLRVVGTAGALVVAVQRRGSRLTHALVLAAIAFAASVGASLTGAGDVSVALSAAAMLVVVAAATAAIAQAVWRPVTDVQEVAGALAIYLLLALFFATLHQLCAALVRGPYLHGVANANDTADFLYFSVVTITTTGFGDLTPASDTARAVTLSEAIVGQLYLVAIVGAVVSSWVRAPRRRGPAAEPSSGPFPGPDDAV